MKPSIFNSVRNNFPKRSVFDLSYDKKFDGDFGRLYPVMCDEVVPGDIISLGNELVIRFQPLVAPILHQIDAFIHYFFVPYRLLWSDWEKFITGGISGDEVPVIPRWDPTGQNAKGTLWDYLGFPVGVVPTGALPLDFPRRAYYFITKHYYRDETIFSPNNDAFDPFAAGNYQLAGRCWQKDYFTSALPWQQRGTAPALPISGSAPIDTGAGIGYGTGFSEFVAKQGTSGQLGAGVFSGFTGTVLQANSDEMRTHIEQNWTADFDAPTATVSTFDVSDLRLAFQVQRWLELNARAGARYTEFLRSHFGVSPRDDRLDRPEYIGGTRSPVIVSEVLQTSSTDAESPQGNLAGHGLVADSQFAGKYKVQEFGLIMGMLSVMPKPAYQQGIDRQWLRRTKFDFYFPEFANLSEQQIERAEIYATGVSAENLTAFGYQGRYDEMRCKRSMVCNNMRDTLQYWHLAREFSSAPTLSEAFLTVNASADDLKRVFAVPAEPGLIINIHNRIKALRPMPFIAEPGLIDHS